MKNLKFLLFIFHLSFIFSDNLWKHEPSGWGYDQTTQQCFYMFMDMQIMSSNNIQLVGVGDGTNIEDSEDDNNGDGFPDSECGLTDECDAIGSFILHTQERDGFGNLTGAPMTYAKCQAIDGTTLWSDDGEFTVEGCELCLGVGYFNSDPEDATTVVAMGISANDNDEKLHYYAVEGDSIAFKFYDASLDSVFDLSISPTSTGHAVNDSLFTVLQESAPLLNEYGLDRWNNLGIFLYENSDSQADSLLFLIDVEIVYGCADSEACNYEGANEDDGSCTYPVDSCTSCDGTDIGGQDCLGVCGGNATEDCNGDCNGSAVPDACGECNGSGVEEACACNDTSGLNENGCCDDIIMGCDDVCGSEAVNDVCGECSGTITNPEDCPTSSNDDFIVYGLEISNIYPNPFNPATNITYSIDNYSKVKIDIYSIDGKIVSNLVNSYQSYGLYTVNWNPENVTTGIYFVKMTVGSFTDTKKIIYIK